jgi:catechol 2,3-dioxygenase-like lactoylglutathione lyase family enzyme
LDAREELLSWMRRACPRSGVLPLQAGVRVLRNNLGIGRRLQIAIDCSDPERLAAFWVEVLGYRTLEPPSGFASWSAFSAAEAHEPGEQWRILVDPASAGPTILFHSVPEAKTTKNRLHLDIWIPHDDPTADHSALVEREAARLVQLAAARIRTRDDDGEFYIVMQDPEGNEFCIA